ncbi:tetratricopeptide repeat protein [Vibrio sp. VB16]|uniref:tetratricopeptide repeat protein n=1 Tax=Vibrio sp. VB16 TaxID=2785746 RepID=UPI00189CFB9F|nr:tetratricopeptide repeat protein [Vibrio sp. VB16]UGA53385.1 tetratricopeptide repeat protein [Vibrio sp. VB16]
MKKTELYSNYVSDLGRAVSTPLLIELSGTDLNSFIDNKQIAVDTSDVALFSAQSVFNHKLSNSDKTNVIVISANGDDPSEFAILEALLQLLRNDLKNIANVQVIKQTIKAGVTLGTSGLLNDFAGGFLDKGVDFIFNEIGDAFSSSIIDSAQEHLDLSSFLLDRVESVLQDTSSAGLGGIMAHHLENHELFLSTEAKRELHKLFKTFSQSEEHNIFPLAFKLLLAVSVGESKLIYINNPHKLDDNSLALLSLVVSYAKYLKEKDKSLGLSIVYQYSDENFQPYQKVEQSLQSKKELLDDQRRFAQRYAILERPSSDIPTIAVKSSLFIGRQDELIALNQRFRSKSGGEQLPGTKQEAVVTNRIAIIAGEPGIGKTALVNQHIKEVQEQGEIISLRLVNEVGHQSMNTGLSSLEKSILSEAPRLELMRDWKDKGIGLIKKAASREGALKVIGAILNGAEEVVHVGQAARERLLVDDRIDKVLGNDFGSIDNVHQQSKEKKFSALDAAIQKLQQINSHALPLVLFVDDLQWIDEISAEYLSTRLLSMIDVYLIATIRPSDAATVLQRQSAAGAEKPFTQSLFKMAAVAGSEKVKLVSNHCSLACTNINLTGLNRASLTELMAKVIQGDKTQLETLSDQVVTKLTDSESKTVNTLFAVETINILCDDKFYEGSQLTRLIVDKPLRINPQIGELDAVIKETFITLEQKHKASLSHYTNAKGFQSFNLMAYAVLEERLHLLRQYFSEFGTTAVSTLLFSSVMGTPFSSVLVKNSLAALAASNAPELAPLKTHLHEGGSDTSLNEEHYVIIEEVYEILKRYMGEQGKYQYRHALLHTFLTMQFDYLMQDRFANEVEVATDTMYRIILDVVEAQHKAQPFYNKAIDSLDSADTSERLFYQTVESSIAKRAKQSAKPDWIRTFYKSSMALAISLSAVNRIEEAIELEGELLVVCEEGFQHDKDAWVNEYRETLTLLASSYEDVGDFSKAIALHRKALSLTEKTVDSVSELDAVVQSNLATCYISAGRIEESLRIVASLIPLLKRNYESLVGTWGQLYVSNLISQAYSFKKLNRFNDAVALEEIALSICKREYEIAESEWERYYVTCMGNLGSSYVKLGRIDEATRIEEQALKVTEACYHRAPRLWKKDYLTRLVNLAATLKKTDRVDDAIGMEQHAYSISKVEYDKTPQVWIEYHTQIMANLASSYDQTGRADEAIALNKEVLTILEVETKNSPKVWSKSYVNILNNLAVSYISVNQIEQAIELQKTAHSISSKEYGKAPKLWVEEHVTALSGLASAYKKNTQYERAIELEQEALRIIAQEVVTQPAAWLEKQVNINRNLAVSYGKVDRCEEAIAIEEELLRQIEEQYSHDSKVWAVDYVITLSNLASSYKKQDHLNDAIALEERALEITRTECQLSPKEWAKYHAEVLANLAFSYSELGNITEAIFLSSEAVKLASIEYEKAPSLWAYRYVNSLDSLSMCYLSIDQVEKAISCAEKALKATEIEHNKSQNVWERSYATSLSNLATCYKKGDKLEEAIIAERKALWVRRAASEKEPDRWGEDFAYGLDALANLYMQVDREEEALSLNKKALEIVDLIEKNKSEGRPVTWDQFDFDDALLSDTKYISHHCRWISRVYAVFSWMFGVLFFVAVFGAVSSGEPKMALICTVIAGLFLPPLRKLVYRFTQRELSFTNRMIMVLVLLALL